MFCLWRFASETRRQAMAVELSNDIDESTFLSAYDAATDDEDLNSFLCINMDDVPKERRFRKNFDRFIQVQDNPQPLPIEPPPEKTVIEEQQS